MCHPSVKGGGGAAAMTVEIFKRILKENNIPNNVCLMSDSGWECDATEMDGLYYHRKTNTIVFTQGCGKTEYEHSREWEILYRPELLKIKNLEIYPISSPGNYGFTLTEKLKKAIREAGDFEAYYGIHETEEAYEQIDLDRPLFYCIKRNGRFVGYIGFHGDDNTLEPEIYILKQYRNKGYGTTALSGLIEIAFGEGLLKKEKGKNDETICPLKLVSTVRAENVYSRKMMETCGFIEKENTAVEFMAFLGEDGILGTDLVEVREYILTREDYPRRRKL